VHAFVQHTGIVAPIRVDNVDTDQIIPSREMKHVSRKGLGEGLFAGWRYQYDNGGADNRKIGLRDDFVLNKPEYSGASIILGGKNWGCGSSREHAVWALVDFGIHAVIAESFGRIFQRNCARNGLLAVEVQHEQIELLERATQASPQSSHIRIDLEKQEIIAPGADVIEFSVPSADRHMLLNGLDYIDFTLQFEKEIDAFRERDIERRPWAYLQRQ